MLRDVRAALRRRLGGRCAGGEDEFGEVLIELAQELLRDDPRADETLGDVAAELAIILREDEPPRHLARHRARASRS